MAGTLLYLLPETPDLQRRATHWWHIVDGEIAAAGEGAEWMDLASAPNGEPTRLVALAPAALVRLGSGTPAAGATARQAAAVARVAALDASLGEREALHAVSATEGDPPERVTTAVVDNGVMLAWLDWSRHLAAEPHHIVPVSALMPHSSDWTRATIGSEQLIARDGVVMPLEPGLVDQLVGTSETAMLGEADVRASLAAAAQSPPLDLRTGRFARRRRIAIDRDRIRELVLLASLIPLLILLWSVVGILKLESATGRLNAQTLALAERTIGRPTSLESAEAELSRQLGGVATGGLMPSLTALYQALQAEEGVSAADISYRGDGTLSVSLAAPTVEGINRVLVALQRNGYRVTAVPRQSPDGRSMVDTTIRSAP